MATAAESSHVFLSAVSSLLIVFHVYIVSTVMAVRNPISHYLSMSRAYTYRLEQSLH